MLDGATCVGSAVSLWGYPVKSMQGEEIGTASISERGIVGDRAYALMDRATGHIASAKHPRKWGKLLQCRAAFTEPPRPGVPLPRVRITLPDGSQISSAARGRAASRCAHLAHRGAAQLGRERDPGTRRRLTGGGRGLCRST